MERGKIIVVANQKGGVAKTSTVRNLSYALAEMGKKVLVVDFDPQYNLTTSFGVLPTQTPCNTGTLITNLLLDESLPDTNEFIQKIGSVDLIPSSRSLTVAEANLLMTPDSNDYPLLLKGRPCSRQTANEFAANFRLRGTDLQ